jgi:hypothetical protein
LCLADCRVVSGAIAGYAVIFMHQIALMRVKLVLQL